MSDPSAPHDGDAVFRDGVSVVHGDVPGELPRVIRLAAYGVIIRDGTILLCHVSPGSIGEGLWTLPGGGLDFGETPEAGAVREVKEETGLVAAITGPPTIHSDVGVWARHAGRVSYHTIRFVYAMRVVGGEERLEVDGSTDAFEWVAIADVTGRALGDLAQRVIDGLERR